MANILCSEIQSDRSETEVDTVHIESHRPRVFPRPAPRSWGPAMVGALLLMLSLLAVACGPSSSPAATPAPSSVQAETGAQGVPTRAAVTLVPAAATAVAQAGRSPGAGQAVPTMPAATATPIPAPTTTPGPRVIQHLGGETEIAGTPERVVALAPVVYESMMALDIKPVATTLFGSGGPNQPLQEVPPYLTEQLAGITLVGERNEPNLEAILAVGPDLIIGWDRNIKVYDALSRIAPSVVLDRCEENCSREQQWWRTSLTTIGQVFGQEEAAQAKIVEYEEHAAAASEKLQEAIGDETVLLMRVLAKGFRVHGPGHSTMGHVLYDDLGLQLPPGIPQDWGAVYVPMEQLVDIDPDRLFLMKGNEERLKELLEGPIWNNLTAVRNNRVYEVDLYWIRGHGWFGKMAIVDDAVRLLAGE